VAVVGLVLDVELCVDVPTIRLLVSITGDLYTARNAFGWLFTFSLNDADLLFSMEGLLRILFVTFPSDARSLVR